MDILNELYLHERQEIMAKITVSGYLATKEGFFDGTKATVGATKGGVQSVKSAIGKLGDSNIFNAIKKAIDEFLNMMQNVIKSIFNGTTKLKKLLKEIESKENKLTPRQDGKEKKSIKTPLLKDLAKMGFSTDPNSQLGQWVFRFESIKKSGTVREQVSFKTLNDTKESLVLLANGASEEAKQERKWKKFDKLTDIKKITPDEFGRVIKERYGFGYTATYKNGRSTKELAAQYFKTPPVSTVQNVDGSAFEIIKETLNFVKEAANLLINQNIDPYLQEELKFIRKTQKEVEQLNRDNIKGAKDNKEPGEEKSVVNESQEKENANPNNFFNTGQKGSGQGYSLIDNIILMDAIRAYGEAEENANPNNSDGTNTTSEQAEDQAKRAQGQETSDSSSSSNKKETEVGPDGSAINGYFEYIRAFLVNYAIAIHKTMNFYNAFVMNLYTAGQRLLNDLSSISVNGNV